MHELGLIEEVLAIVSEESKGARVKRIVLELGALALALPDALRFAFELAREGTVAEQAELEIVAVPGSARCRSCGAESALEDPHGRCACGSFELEWLSGQEIKVRSMEIV
jgi:hydrogenase nickel incorporation protein HypA/HybF